LLQDLFPDVSIPPSISSTLSTTIANSFTAHQLQTVPTLQNKILQLYDTFNVRFGVMLVGLAGSGKTTCYQILQDAMSELRKKDHPDQNYQVVRTYVLNPKCISMGELYGEVNPFTEEWQDGLASGILREVAADESADKKKDRLILLILKKKMFIFLVLLIDIGLFSMVLLTLSG
jgi:dynein heavy chain, axonemal